MKSVYDDNEEYTTKDGSLIRELMHPDVHGVSGHGVKNQSLAIATVPEGICTKLHKHIQSEELYHIMSGYGLMTLAERQFDVSPGDTICIPPGTAHCIKNTGQGDLKMVCCCSPAYSHEDTEIM